MYQPMLCGHEQFMVSVSSLDKFPAHFHSELEIIYCISGGFRMKINHQELHVTRGQAVFVGSAEEHEYLGSEDGTRALVAEIGYSFLGERFSELAKLQFTSPVLHMEAPRGMGEADAECLRDLFGRLAELRRSPSGEVWEEWSTRACLFHLAALTVRAVPHADRLSDQRRARIQATLNIQPALRHIKEHYASKVTVDDVAGITGYEKSNFCKQFKTATQSSFHKYLNTYRIGVACRLIELGDAPIQTIGERVGIPEAKSFSRIFRQVVGMTPTQYKSGGNGRI